MVARRVYDLLSRWWAPWDAVGCSTAANVAFLAERGFTLYGEARVVEAGPLAIIRHDYTRDPVNVTKSHAG